MVQCHLLLDLDGVDYMTLITFTDGKPVMRDGKVGTESGCCCAFCLYVGRHGNGNCGRAEDDPYFDPTFGYCNQIKQERDFIVEVWRQAGWTVTTEDLVLDYCTAPENCLYVIDSATCSHNMCCFLDDLPLVLPIDSTRWINLSEMMRIEFPYLTTGGYVVFNMEGLINPAGCCPGPIGAWGLGFDESGSEDVYIPICSPSFCENPLP